MNLVVLALATSSVSPALSAPTSYRYGKLAVHDSRGVRLSNPAHEIRMELVTEPEPHAHEDTESRTDTSESPPADRMSITSTEPLIDDASRNPDHQVDPDPHGAPDPHDPDPHGEPDPHDPDPPPIYYPPTNAATNHPAPIDTDKWYESPYVVGSGFVSAIIAGTTWAVYASGKNAGQNHTTQNHTTHTHEPLRGRANAELMERAPGDHDLDK